MKPYDIINQITEDILSSTFGEDYCLQYFRDNIRFLDDGLSFYGTFDKHVDVGNKSVKDNLPENYFYHKDKWFFGRTLNYHLRYNTKNNFLQHSWEPIDIDLDKNFWGHTKDIIIIHSETNSNDIEKLNYKNVHWFAHAYLCSEFYFRHYQKLDIVKNYMARPIKHRWLCTNRLLRQHRVDLLESIDLSKGCYSFMNPDPNGFVYKGKVKSYSFDSHSNDSAEICIDRLTPWNTSFLHVVSETVWQDKIHFTEKVFKPIVLHQPFVILQAPGSLEYLRSYGFRTFDNWFDESYDNIKDPIKRLKAIADIIDYVGNKSLDELEQIRMEMAEVLEYNFCHFYENLPAICLEELKKGIKLL